MAKAVAHSYGKDAISVYRIAGDSLFACEARVIVRGEAFETSYTEGDNSMVVATDSMKNFVHAMGLEYEGDTLEGFVELVGSRLLARYDHMEGVQVSAKQVPFEHVRGNVMRRRYDDFAVAELDLDRIGRRLGALRLARSPPDQADGKLVRRLRPRRVHDAAGGP